MNEALAQRVREWIEADPDAATQAELSAILNSGDEDALLDRMSPLMFGTAGIRAPVGAGAGRMNRAVVRRTTAGLAAHVVRGRSRGVAGPVVLGYDARLTSRTFAEDAARVFAAAGLDVHMFDEPVPTPLVAFAARKLSAATAVCVTASHNPAADNGYKVYGPNAVQIVPPEDQQIATLIADAPGASDVPMATGPGASVWTRLGEPMIEAYMDSVQSLVRRAAPESPTRDLSIVYTPVHGVGGAYTPRALKEAGFENVFGVAEQMEPDGHFPTAPAPNPENPVVLAPARKCAAARSADLILANDPDADRLAVCVPEGPQPTQTGGAPARYLNLSGNQIGILLAEFILANNRSEKPMVLSSVPSTPMVEKICAAHGARHVTTLTGFKWIWNRALEMEAEGAGHYVFGFEEAIGYGVGEAVRDKDGISAAVLFAQLVSTLSDAGRTVWDELGRLYTEHGLWVSTQYALSVTDRGPLELAMNRLASSPPEVLEGRTVTGVRDFRSGYQGLPPAEMVELVLASGRVVLRPSGTEPKVKFYADLNEPFDPASTVPAQLKAAEERAQTLAKSVAELLLKQ